MHNASSSGSGPPAICQRLAIRELTKSPFLERIPVRQREEVVLVPVAQVTSIVAEGKLLHILGPGQDIDGIAFARVEDAIKRGSEIAIQSGVSLWDATTDRPLVVVDAFRR